MATRRTVEDVDVMLCYTLAWINIQCKPNYRTVAVFNQVSVYLMLEIASSGVDLCLHAGAYRFMRQQDRVLGDHHISSSLSYQSTSRV